MRMGRSFVIGDVHGHLDRLEALLRQEGLLDEPSKDGRPERVQKDVEVIQLGDLGHYSGDTQARDRSTWASAPSFLDVILWGNHDRAVVSGRHAFRGFQHPFPETKDDMMAAVASGKVRLAHASNGFLLTHAGLHPRWVQYVPDKYRHHTENLAKWLNDQDHPQSEPQGIETDFESLRDLVGPVRGGWGLETAGGILWRDATEKLATNRRQIFGHTAFPNEVRVYGPDGLPESKADEDAECFSYCIDVGTKTNGRLVGLWLPEERVVEVDLGASV